METDNAVRHRSEASMGMFEHTIYRWLFYLEVRITKLNPGSSQMFLLWLRSCCDCMSKDLWRTSSSAKESKCHSFESSWVQQLCSPRPLKSHWDSTSGTVHESSYVNGQSWYKFTIPYNVEFMNGILMRHETLHKGCSMYWVHTVYVSRFCNWLLTYLFVLERSFEPLAGQVLRDVS